MSYFSFNFPKSILHAFCVILSDQEAGNDGTFCAGGMLLLAEERIGHLFSGLEGGLVPSKMSVSDGDGEGVATGIGDSVAIVAYQATRQDERVLLVCKNWTLLFSKTKKFQKQALTPLSKQITIVWGRGSQP